MAAVAQGLARVFLTLPALDAYRWLVDRLGGMLQQERGGRRRGETSTLSSCP